MAEKQDEETPVDHIVIRRVDSEGRDVTHMPGLHSEEDRLERLVGQAAEFSVYVSTSITTDDALRMMIENYSA